MIETNIEANRKEDVRIDFAIVDDDGEAVNITGYTMVFELLEQYTSSTALVTKNTSSGITLSTPTSGLGYVSLSSANLDLSAAIYWYTLSRTDSGNKSVLAGGKFVLGQPAVGT